MNPYRILAAVLLVASLAPSALAGGSRPERPNIVIVLADDLGVGDLACYTPACEIPTPSIDRMAVEGVRFTDAHSPASVCTPTRYAIQTGRYGWRTRLQRGVLALFDPPLIEPERVTLPELLRDAGYATGAFGKWHLGLDFATTDGGIARMDGDRAPDNVDLKATVLGGPLEHGYDVYFGAQQRLLGAFLENRHVVGEPRALFSGRGYKIRGWKEADRGPAQWERVHRFVREQADADRPFFVYYAVPYPHVPYSPADSLAGRPVAGVSGMSARADLVVELDVTIGALMDLFEELDLSRETWLVLASDNGGTRHLYDDDAAEAHDPAGGYRGRKGEIWEAGHRIPLIVRWGDGSDDSPAPPGRVTDHLVGLQDLYRTVAEATGCSVPYGEGGDSVSFLSVVTGKEVPARPPLVLHSVSGRFALRDGRWKLVMPEPGTDDPVELYDLQEDPFEEHDRAAERPETVERLRALLEAERG